MPKSPTTPHFIDQNGAIVFVSSGIAPVDGDTWLTFRQKNTVGTHRVKSPYLPIRKTPAEAEADLSAYAAKHGWKETCHE